MKISVLQLVFGNWNRISVEVMIGLGLVWEWAVAIKLARMIRASQRKANPVPGLMRERIPQSPAAA